MEENCRVRGFRLLDMIFGPSSGKRQHLGWEGSGDVEAFLVGNLRSLESASEARQLNVIGWR